MLPVAGVTLPLISYGGSSLMTVMVALGPGDERLAPPLLVRRTPDQPEAVTDAVAGPERSEGTRLFPVRSEERDQGAEKNKPSASAVRRSFDPYLSKGGATEIDRIGLPDSRACTFHRSEAAPGSLLVGKKISSEYRTAQKVSIEMMAGRSSAVKGCSGQTQNIGRTIAPPAPGPGVARAVSARPGRRAGRREPPHRRAASGSAWPVSRARTHPRRPGRRSTCAPRDISSSLSRTASTRR